MGIRDWLFANHVKKLLKGLESNSLEVQKKSAMALLEVKDKVMDELIRNFENLNSAGQKNLIVVMGKANDIRAAELLIKILKESSDPILKDKAIESLMALGKDLVAIPLLKAMHGQSSKFLTEALKILEKMNLDDIPKDKKIYFYIAKDEYHECIDIGEAAVDPLLEALEEHKENPDRTRSIVIVLGKLGYSKAIPPLSQLLSNEDKYVRERTVEALGKIGDKRAIEPLINALRDKNAWVRKSAAKALDELCWTAEDKYDEASYQVAQQNYKKCIEIGSPAVDILTDILSSPDELDDESKKEIIYTIGKIGDIQGAWKLIHCLKDRDNGVRDFAIDALKDMGAKVSNIILNSLSENKDDRTKEALVKILGYIGDDYASSQLLSLLHGEKPLIKAVIIETLGKLKYEDALNTLIDIVQQKSGGKQVIESAIVALGELGEEAVDPLIELLRGGQYTMGNIKTLAIQSLGKIGNDIALDKLIQCTRDPSCALTAIEALGKIKNDEAAEALFLLVMEEEDIKMEIRIAAIKALEAIGGEEIQSILYGCMEELENEALKKTILKSLNNLGTDIKRTKPKKFKRGT